LGRYSSVGIRRPAARRREIGRLLMERQLSGAAVVSA